MIEVIAILFAIFVAATIPLYFWDRWNKHNIGINNRTQPGMAIFGAVFTIASDPCVHYIHRSVFEFLLTRFYVTGTLLRQLALAVRGSNVYIRPFSWVSSKHSRVARWLVALSRILTSIFGSVVYMNNNYRLGRCEMADTRDECHLQSIHCTWQHDKSKCETEPVTLKFVIAGVTVSTVLASMIHTVLEFLVDNVISKYPDSYCLPASGGFDTGVPDMAHICNTEVNDIFEQILQQETTSRGGSADGSDGSNSRRVSELQRIPVAVGLWRYVPVEEKASATMTVVGLGNDGSLVPLSCTENLFFSTREELLSAKVAKARVRSRWISAHIMSIQPYLGEARRDRIGYGSSENIARSNFGHVGPLLFLHIVLEHMSPVARCLFEERLLAVNWSRPGQLHWRIWLLGWLTFLSINVAMLCAVFLWATHVDSISSQSDRRQVEVHTWWVVGASLLFDLLSGVIMVCIVYVGGPHFMSRYFRRCAKILSNYQQSGNMLIHHAVSQQQQSQLENGDERGHSYEPEGTVVNELLPVALRTQHTHTDEISSLHKSIPNSPSAATGIGPHSDLNNLESADGSIKRDSSPGIWTAAQHLLSSCRASTILENEIGSFNFLAQVTDEDFLSCLGCNRLGFLECVENYLYLVYPLYASAISTVTSRLLRGYSTSLISLLLCAFVMVNSAILDISGYLLGSFYVITSLIVFFALNSIHYEEGGEGNTCEGDGIAQNWTASWRENSGPINGGQASPKSSSSELVSNSG